MRGLDNLPEPSMEIACLLRRAPNELFGSCAQGRHRRGMTGRCYGVWSIRPSVRPSVCLSDCVVLLCFYLLFHLSGLNHLTISLAVIWSIGLSQNINSFICSFNVNSIVHSLVLCIRSFVHSLVLCICSLVHWLICAFVHLCVQSLISCISLFGFPCLLVCL